MNLGYLLLLALLLLVAIHYVSVRAFALARREEATPFLPPWLPLALVLVGLIWLLVRVRAVLLPFLVGGAIAYSLNPVVDRLERRGWSRRWGVLVVFLCFLLIFLALAFNLIPRVADEVRALVDNYQAYTERAQQVTTSLMSSVERVAAYWGVLPDDVRSSFEKLGESIKNFIPGFLERAVGFLGQSMSLVFLLILTPLVTFWLLREYHVFGRQLLVFVPRRHRATAVAVVGEVNRLVGSYFFGMAIMCLLMAAVAMITLVSFGVSYGLLLGLIIGLGYLIPYVGIPSSLALTLLTAAAVDHKSVGQLVIIGLIILAVNQSFDLVVTPRVIGQRVGLHPLIVIFALLAAGQIFGLPGAIIAIPLAAAIKVVLRRFVPELFEGAAPIAARAEASQSKTQPVAGSEDSLS